jgi:hypothetical protein
LVSKREGAAFDPVSTRAIQEAQLELCDALVAVGNIEAASTSVPVGDDHKSDIIGAKVFHFKGRFRISIPCSTPGVWIPIKALFPFLDITLLADVGGAEAGPPWLHARTVTEHQLHLR